MLPPTNSETFTDFISDWKTLALREKDLGAFLTNDNFSERVKNCSKSIFEYYQRMPKTPSRDSIEFLQLQESDLREIYRTLSEKLEFDKHGKEKLEFLGLANLINCSIALSKLKTVDPALPIEEKDKIVTENYSKIQRMLPSAFLYKINVTANDEIKAILREASQNDSFKEIPCTTAKALAAKKCLSLATLPSELTEHVGFHGRVFFKGAEELISHTEINSDFERYFQGFVRFYAESLLKDYPVGSYLLRKSTDTNRIIDKRYVSVALTFKESWGIGHCLFYYDSQNKNWISSDENEKPDTSQVGCSLEILLNIPNGIPVQEDVEKTLHFTNRYRRLVNMQAGSQRK